jgi:radical SAM protein with 4Fe4S-binding SPASM domain
VQPCVYWPGTGAPLDVLLDAGSDVVETQAFVDARSVPEACGGCAHLAACRGGCSGRRRLMDALAEPDPYCPVIRGETRKLSIRMAPTREMPKLESACTTIVMAR